MPIGWLWSQRKDRFCDTGGYSNHERARTGTETRHINSPTPVGREKIEPLGEIRTSLGAQGNVNDNVNP